MNPKLHAIMSNATGNFQTLMRESEAKLLEAWNQCEQEAQDQETKPKFRFAFTVTLDLDNDSMQCDLAFGVRHKLSTSQPIPDPQQLKLEAINAN